MKTSYWFFLLLAAPLCAQVNIERGDGHISVIIDGKPFTTLYCGPETGKPYLHPLRSASGKIVTRGYPMENVPGETHDHPHQRGLWFSHGNVNGYDFWSNEPSQHDGKNTRIALKNVAKAAGGKESGVESLRPVRRRDGARNEMDGAEIRKDASGGKAIPVLVRDRGRGALLHAEQ